MGEEEDIKEFLEAYQKVKEEGPAVKTADKLFSRETAGAFYKRGDDKFTIVE